MPIEPFTGNTITMMQIQDQNPKEWHKIKELSEKVKQRGAQKLNIKVTGTQPMALVQNGGPLNDL